MLAVKLCIVNCTLLYITCAELVEVLGVIRTVVPARDAEGLHVEVLGQNNRLNGRTATSLSRIQWLFCARGTFYTPLSLFVYTEMYETHTNYMENVLLFRLN